MNEQTERASRPLTRREAEVARLVASGRTTREVAAKLGLSGRTVDTHIARAMKKLGLRSRLFLASSIIPEPKP